MTYRTAAERPEETEPRPKLSDEQAHALYAAAALIGTFAVIGTIGVLAAAGARVIAWDITAEQARWFAVVGTPSLLGTVFSLWVASIWWRRAR